MRPWRRGRPLHWRRPRRWGRSRSHRSDVGPRHPKRTRSRRHLAPWATRPQRCALTCRVPISGPVVALVRVRVERSRCRRRGTTTRATRAMRVDGVCASSHANGRSKHRASDLSLKTLRNALRAQLPGLKLAHNGTRRDGSAFEVGFDVCRCRQRAARAIERRRPALAQCAASASRPKPLPGSRTAVQLRPPVRRPRPRPARSPALHRCGCDQPLRERGSPSARHRPEQEPMKMLPAELMARATWDATRPGACVLDRVMGSAIGCAAGHEGLTEVDDLLGCCHDLCGLRCCRWWSFARAVRAAHARKRRRRRGGGWRLRRRPRRGSSDGCGSW